MRRNRAPARKRNTEAERLENTLKLGRRRRESLDERGHAPKPGAGTKEGLSSAPNITNSRLLRPRVFLDT